MENILENKAKFFALYYGQEVLTRDDGFHKFWKLGSEVSVESALSRHGYDYKYYLELKHLSSISDDDAKKLGFRDSEHFKLDANEYFRKDELRSLGYAIEWHGTEVDKLIDYGWIKLKED